jgi:hypothetical protein
MEQKFKLPTETITLPSKGLLYSAENPLSKGEIEMSYMSAKHEDILTNMNYIKNGTAIDKLLQALVVTPINFDDLIVGDKNAILIAARILGYGKDYPIRFYNTSTRSEDDYTIDLTTLNEKEVDQSLFTSGKNEFMFTLPQSKNNITFKFLTGADEKKITQEINGLKKLYPNDSFDLTTRLKYMITSVEGSRETKDIREFVDNYLTAQDSRAFREYYAKSMPDINLDITVEKDEYTQEGVTVPIGINFFWPDSGV